MNRIILTIALLLCSAIALLAVEKQPAPLTPADMGAASVKVIMPKSVDILNALDSLSKGSQSAVNWKKLVAYTRENEFFEKTNYSDNPTRALNLGLRVANAFIAVEAEDKEALDKTSDTLVVLGRSLGVAEEIIGQRERIGDLARANKWQQVRQTVLELQEQVEEQLQNKDRRDEATLVVTAGWLQGLHAVTKALSENYSPEAASILRQGDLVKSLETQLQALGDEAKGHALVKRIIAKLPDIQRMCAVAQEQPVTQENTKKLFDISSELVSAISKG